MKMLKREATVIMGGLSKTSKMPGKSFGISAEQCNTGAKLAKIPGSICESCYALKGCYQWQSTKNAHARRLEALAHPEWIPAMVKLISGEKWFRWFDSGDLQSMDNLHMITEVCNQTPNTSHWLPTKERKLINRYLRENTEGFPDNLVVRLSAAMFDARPPTVPAGINTSTSHKNFPAQGKACKAPNQGNACKACRMCWDGSINNVSYKAH